MSGYDFTDRVRRALRLAREQAATLRQDHVGPEHLLLGILEEGEGIAISVLDDLGVDRHRLRRDVQASAPVGSRDDRSWPADLPYSASAKRALELAVSEAQELHHTYVGTEHVVLGLLHREAVPAATCLERGGARLEAARDACRRLSGATPGPSRIAAEDPRSDRAPARIAVVLSVVALLVALLALVLVITRFGR
jgi:ATP-dependent Clp protease ATP-binding subunit ClpA